MVSKTVLVIDDNPKICDMMLLMLSGIGMKAHTATSGSEGISKAVEVNPDLILLDIILPDLDGWAVLNHIRCDPNLCDTPVVIFSALADYTAHMRRRFEKVDGFLTKPFRVEELLDIIQTTTDGTMAC